MSPTHDPFDVFLHPLQTGEQVMNMAQGAMDSVKSAINKE